MLSFDMTFSCWVEAYPHVKSLIIRMILAFLISLVSAAILAPIITKYLKKRKMEQVFRDQKEVHRLAELHGGKVHTPTMGGIIVVLATLIGTAAVVHWNVPSVLTVACYLLYALIGFIDDFLKIHKHNTKGIPGRMKLFIMLLTTVGLVWILRQFPEAYQQSTSMQVPFSSSYITLSSTALVIIFLFFVLAGTSNAVNLTDGLDGLATGCSIPVLLFLSLASFVTSALPLSNLFRICYTPGSEELAVICASAIGASCVFLWHNCFPATIFMGDMGSLSLGMLIGIIAFLSGNSLHLVIAGFIFVVEALSDIIQVFSYKFRKKHRVFKMAPIHHHFELSGYHESKIALRFWILSAMFACIAAVGLFRYF